MRDPGDPPPGVGQPIHHGAEAGGPPGLPAGFRVGLAALGRCGVEPGLAAVGEQETAERRAFLGGSVRARRREADPDAGRRFAEDRLRVLLPDDMVPVEEAQSGVVGGFGLHRRVGDPHPGERLHPVRPVEQEPAPVPFPAAEADHHRRVAQDAVRAQPLDQRGHPRQVHLFVEDDVPQGQDFEGRRRSVHEVHESSLPNRRFYERDRAAGGSFQRRTVKRSPSSINSGSVPLCFRMPGTIFLLTPIP